MFLFYLPHASNHSEFITKLQLFSFQWNPNSIIIGYFNYTSSQPFPNLISNCNLKRYIKSPIHDKGTIDLLITPKSCYITKPLSIGSLFSNCHATLFKPYHPKQTRPTSMRSYINSMIFQLRNLYLPLNYLQLPHQSYFTKSFLPLLNNFASLNAKRTICTMITKL